MMESQERKNEDEKEEKCEIEDNQLSDDANTVLDAQKINDEEHTVIKGDTIGETVYSAKWVLNILISLSKVYEDGWNESIENDLCTLWDMTAEKDVVEFLLANDFYKMAEFTIKTSEEPRLTEIIVGIIGNMSCQATALDTLVNIDTLVSLTLSLISSDDKETLIQVFRIYQAATWDIQKNNESLWLKKIKECEILGEAVCFILKSSTSDELLTAAIDFVYLISDIELSSRDDIFEDIFDVDQLIFSLCESMVELVNQTDNPHTEAQFKNIENWFNIMFNIIKKKLLKFSASENDENFKRINAVLLKILQPYKNFSNLIPCEEKCLLSIQQCIKMVLSFQKNEMFPQTELIQTILKIMLNLKAVVAENEFENENSEDFQQLHDYIAYYWVETLKITSKEQIRRILQLCDYETVNKIIQETNSLSGVPESWINGLLQIRSMIFSI